MTLFPKRSARALWQAGDRARDARNWVEAKSAYAEAIKLCPSRYGLWLQYGHAAKEVGDFADAEAAYRTALVLEPNRGEGHRQLAYLLQRTGRLREAEHALAKARHLDGGGGELPASPAPLNGAAVEHGMNGSANRIGAYDVAMLNVKTLGYALARALGENLNARTVSRAPQLELASKLCTQSDIESDWAAYWARELKTPLRYHRKVWEFCYIAQVLGNAGKLKSGCSGLGFGCGEEPLIGVLAKHGARVLATDLPQDEARRAGWETAPEERSAFRRHFAEICPDPSLRENIDFRPLDMRNIPDDLARSFDFCWSACSLEHLGSIEAGLRFIEESVKTLKPGGVAVHTTEFNLLDGDTLDHQSTVLFQRSHMEEIAARLTRQGYRVATLDFERGSGFLDGFVDIPPWPHTAHPLNPGEPDAHLKLNLDGFVCTSFGLSIYAP